MSQGLTTGFSPPGERPTQPSRPRAPPRPPGEPQMPGRGLNQKTVATCGVFVTSPGETARCCPCTTRASVSHSKPGSRARSGTSIKMFLGCSRSRSASVADQLDRPPAPLDLVSRTELSPMLVPRSLVSIGTIHFASALCWWLVAVVGELTSSFLITSLL